MKVPQPSGGTIFAPHISKPVKKFTVEWFSPEFTNVIQFADTVRTQTVLAENPNDAIEVAQYHHYRGFDFRVIG